MFFAVEFVVPSLAATGKHLRQPRRQGQEARHPGLEVRRRRMSAAFPDWIATAAEGARVVVRPRDRVADLMRHKHQVLADLVSERKLLMPSPWRNRTSTGVGVHPRDVSPSALQRSVPLDQPYSTQYSRPASKIVE